MHVKWLALCLTCNKSKPVCPQYNYGHFPMSQVSASLRKSSSLEIYGVVPLAHLVGGWGNTAQVPHAQGLQVLLPGPRRTSTPRRRDARGLQAAVAHVMENDMELQSQLWGLELGMGWRKTEREFRRRTGVIKERQYLERYWGTNYMYLL